MQVISKSQNKEQTVFSVPSTQFIFLPFILIAIYSFFSQYLLLSITSAVAITIIINQIWKPYIPPILLYFFGIQWLQVFTVILYADYLGEPIDNIFSTSNSEFLIGITLLQLVSMVIITSLFFRRNLNGSLYKIVKGALQINTKKVLFGYLICTLIFPFLLALTRNNGTINQLVQSAAVFRYVFLILLAFILFIKKEYRGLIILIFCAEFILGFVSYFSSFKEVILFLIMVYLTIHSKLKASLLLKLSPLIAFLIFVFIFWSYVKPVYREFINAGSGQQQVNVSTTQALNFLGDQVKTFDKKAFDSGTETFLLRIQAMAYYLEVYNRVPSIIPFEKGKNLGNCADFLLMPRFLKENKGILDPSSKLSYYSGREFKTAAEGTSIAMGYFCDFYVDYGIWGMFIPILILGAFLGWSANFILNLKKYNVIFIYALLIGFFLHTGTLESDIIFFLGAIRNLFVIFLIGNWFIFPWLNKQLTT